MPLKVTVVGSFVCNSAVDASGAAGGVASPPEHPFRTRMSTAQRRIEVSLVILVSR